MRPSEATFKARLDRRSQGFTLIEVIVVLVILSIMVAISVPKLVRNQDREFNLAVDQIADLLTIYAQREMLSSKVVGLSHDRSRNWIFLQVLDTASGGVDEAAEWTMDFFTSPVKLPRFIAEADVRFYADGDLYDASEWPLATNIGEERPRIDVVVRGPSHEATVTLHPHAMSPVIVNGDQAVGVIRTQLDLDASGLNREDW